MIRPARPDEAAILTRLVLASKRHWGYAEELIDLWRDDLAIDARTFETCEVWVAEERDVTKTAGEGARPVGVAALSRSGDTAELEHLWVEPASMGHGVGRALFERAVRAARAARARRVVIVSDPNAERFYLRLGARREGEVPSRPPGRMLPRLVLELAATEA